MSLNIRQIEATLKNLGFINLNIKSRNRISILTNDDRSSVLRQVALAFSKRGAVYDPFYTTSSGAAPSSVGVVLVDNKLIFAKPLNKQGFRSAGISSEIAFLNAINQHLDNGYGLYHTITIVLQGGGKRIVIPKVLIAQETVRSGNLKSDIILIRDGLPNYPISLKKVNAEFWDSSTNLYAYKAISILQTLEQSGETDITRTVGNRVDLGSNIGGIAVRANDAEARMFVFGADIEGNGSVIKQTFSGNNHMNWNDETLTLTISCNKIYETLQDVRNSSDDPYMLIKKSTGSPGFGATREYSGLKFHAVFKKRIHGNVITYLRENFPG